ncbi:hypothetical protein P3W66_25320, partial [Achromobacter denitrificans]|nr:hypothetical protein [Achromobacter denitrificans]
VIGGKQVDALQRMTGSIGFVARTTTAASAAGVLADPNFSVAYTSPQGSTSGSSTVSFDSARAARSSSETRPVNVAFHPRIHA